MSSAVAPVRVTIEQAHSASTASSMIGSNGSVSPTDRGGAATGTSSTSRIGVVTAGGVISTRVRLADDELDRLPEPLRHDRARDRGRSRRAPAAVLDRHRDDDRAHRVVDEADVPGLVVGAAGALGGSGLAEHRVALLRPALPDVGGRAVDRRLVQTVEDRLARAGVDPDRRGGTRLDALQDAAAGVLDRGPEVRAHAV